MKNMDPKQKPNKKKNEHESLPLIHGTPSPVSKSIKGRYLGVQ